MVADVSAPPCFPTEYSNSSAFFFNWSTIEARSSDAGAVIGVGVTVGAGMGVAVGAGAGTAVGVGATVGAGAVVDVGTAAGGDGGRTSEGVAVASGSLVHALSTAPTRNNATTRQITIVTAGPRRDLICGRADR